MESCLPGSDATKASSVIPAQAQIHRQALRRIFQRGCGDRSPDRGRPWTNQHVTLGPVCRSLSPPIAASPADTARPGAASGNEPTRNPAARSRSTPERVWPLLAFAAILGIAAGSGRAAPAEECPGGQILKVLANNITMTVTKDGAGVAVKEKVTKRGSTMKMPLCVLHNDRKKRRYTIRLPDGAEAVIVRRYVLESTDKPPIVIDCKDHEIYQQAQEGGVRGIGEDPCD